MSIIVLSSNCYTCTIFLISVCCREMGVSEDCIPIMCSAIPTQYGPGESISCLGQYDKVFTCIARM